jgi:hypothetical protein
LQIGVGEYIEMRKKKEENKKLQFGIIQAIHQPVKLDNRYSISEYQKNSRIIQKILMGNNNGDF